MAYDWIISGRVLKIDGITPFASSDGLSLRLFSAGSAIQLGNAGVGDNDGNFSFTLGKQQFGNANPDLVIKVFDGQERLLYLSGEFSPSQSEDSYSIGNAKVNDMPVPHTWYIRGRAFNQDATTPFSQGIIRAYDGETGAEQYAESGFWDNGQEGSFCLTIARNSFQGGDVNIVAPRIIIRIFDYSQNLLWQYGPFTVPHCDYYINPLITIPAGGSIVPNIPVVPEDWSVSGTLRHADGSPAAQPFTVKAYDVLYNSVETFLGAVQSNSNGAYQIDYAKGAFQNGDAGRVAPNLRIKVFSEDVLAAASGVFYQAANVAEIDVSFAYAQQNREVSGFVRDSQGYLVGLGTVHAYDVSGGAKTELGSTSLGSSGHYRISFSKSSAPNLKVCLYYPAGTLLAESDTIINAPPAKVIDLYVRSGGSADSDSEYCVYGYVINMAQLPVAFHKVEAYALRIASGKFEEIYLGDAVTDVHGYYEIGYDPDLLEFPIAEDPSSHGAETDSLFIKLPREPDEENDESQEEETAPQEGAAAVEYDTSPLACHSAKRQQIDIQVDRSSGSDYSEYDLVSAAVSAYVSAMEYSLSDHEPDFSNRMQYISCKAGVEEGRVVCFYYSENFYKRVEDLLKVSSNSSALSNIPSDFKKFMYAAFRAGYPGNDVLALCAADSGGYYKALVDAVKDKIIPESAAANLEAFWSKWLEIVRILIAWARPTNAAEASVGLFARTVLEVDNRSYPSKEAFDPISGELWKVRKVIEIHQDAQGDMPSFWDAIAAAKEFDGNGLFAAKLAFINDLYSISSSFVPFAQGAYDYFVRKIDSSSPDAYDIRSLASFSDSEWLGMTRNFTHYTEGEYPKHLTGTTDEEKLHILAAATRELYEGKFPLENAAAVYSGQEGNQALQSIGAFLKSDAAEGFDLDSSNIDACSLPSGVDADTLKALQRVNRLTEDPDAQIYLLGKGYDSSCKIAAIEEEKFVADNAEELGGIDEARQVHRLAAMYATETLSILGKFHGSLNLEGDSIKAVSRGLSRGFSEDASSSGKDSVPTYKTLFGTIGEPRFANSQSVFGASAYFTDILGFIDGLSRASLFSRRPELKEIELTNGNAETVLPYIDIVTEILENAISPRMFFFRDSGEVEAFLSAGAQGETATFPLSLKEAFDRRAVDIPSSSKIKKSLTKGKENDYYLSTGSWRAHFERKSVSDPPASGYLVTMYPQTSKDSSELSIMPEHRNPLAYEALSKLYFPLQLPLSPAADEVQETMRLLGTSKYDSIIAFRREERYSDTDGSLVCANLGISQDIKALLESALPAGVEPWELWGLQEETAEGSWVSAMSFVPEFMRRTGLDVEGMLDVLALKTLNGDGRIHLCSEDDKGKLTGDPDYFKIDDLNADDLTSIHRLIRLRGILKCSWKELDCFLISAHGGALPDDLSKISVSRLFMARYPSVSFADIGCFWGPLAMLVDGRFGKSPFEERFIAKRLGDDSIALFKDLTGSEPVGNDKPKQALRQALQLSVEDLDFIIKRELDADAMLDIGSISAILRVVLLAKALKLGIEDFYAMRDITEINPFNASKPEDLLCFADECGKLSKRGIKAAAVKKFLEKDSPADQNAQWVRSALQSLRRIVEETEAFLASGAVPDFGREEEDWGKFKEKYREEHTRLHVENLLTELFSEFTGGDSELANSFFEKDEDGRQTHGIWSSLANAGWSRSLNGEASSIADNFSLPKDFLASGNRAAWSAFFIVPKERLSFKLDSDACNASIEINGNAYNGDGNSDLNFSVGEAAEIKIIVSNFDDAEKYYLDLQWKAEADAGLSGEPAELLAKVPISALIPKDNSWADFEALEKALESTLPALRKMAEYLGLTKASPKLFRTVAEKGKENSEWEILLPEDLPLELSGYSEAWKKFKRLLDIQTLETNFPAAKGSLWEMIEEAEKAENAGNALERLADMQDKWSRANLIDAVKESIPEIKVNDAKACDIASPAMLAYILENMPLIEKIGAPVKELLEVQEESPSENAAANFRGALQQRLGMSSWSKMAEDMMNAMRIRQRDAMTAFLTYAGPSIKSTDSESAYAAYLREVLLNAGMLENESGNIFSALRLYCELTEEPALKDIAANWEIGPEQWAILDGRRGYRDSNELYAHFLIDTEMNTEMITSRIVQSSAAVQLFVQRTLLGLEPASQLDERDIAQWVWMKNYRVWEANRKVFLYPENWIEPELRDDKTPFFKEFEAEFENGEITSEIAKNALGNFLGKMRETAGLDVIGVYRGDSEVPRGMDTLHIIGKTKSLPHKYYYRKCHRKSNLANVWAPWETVDIDMQGKSVLPVVFNGHLYVFWAQFKPTDMPGEADSISHVDSKGNDVELPVPTNIAVVELSLCWSALAGGKWTEKKQTPPFIDAKNSFYTNQDPEASVADRYHFRVKEASAEYVQIEVSGTFEAIKLPEDEKARKRFLKRLQKNPHKVVEKVLKISVLGIYTVWHDGNVSFAKADDDGSDFHCDPKDMVLTENYAYSSSSQALTRLSGAKLLGKTASGHKYLAANSGQLSGSSYEPGFLMEDARTYLIERSDNGRTAATYRMEAVSHPIVKEFQKRFESGGLPSLMRRETQALAMATGGYYGYSYYSYNYYYSVLLGYYIAGDWQAWDAGQNAFELRYLPGSAVSRPFPMEVVDFNYGTPYGIYNWELFFHAPFLAARQLAANQRYDEALDWYHLIFDPRNNKLSGYEKTKRWALNLPAGARFWNFLPFFANADADKTMTELMGLPDSRGELPDSQALKTLMDDWKDDPFNPHLIARSRIVAYQKTVVMHYLDALVAWADQKFRVDTLESVNEAIQLYILAAEILGPRPQSVPSDLEASPLSYTQMREMSMDTFSNAVIQLENSIVKPVADAKSTGQGAVDDSASQILSLGPKMYYFVVPRNEKLMGYWDLLDDRLFKIRNGMNIEGVRRQLSLFAPPIDPGMLVRAAAAGIDIGAALNDMFAPVPQYRFTFMVQKAIDLCNIAQSMGGAILSALEKKDAEEIARLRAEHESTLLKLSREVRKMQIEEAGIAIEGLEKTKENTELRREHYEKLIEGDISDLEQSQLAQMDEAIKHSEKANDIRKGASIASAIPDFGGGASGFGGSPVATIIVSTARAAHIYATIKASNKDFLASQSQNSASQAGINAGYERRKQEWEFQKVAAEKELEGIDLQILGAQIRKEVAEKELGNLEKQIEQSAEAYEFLKGKFSSKELYQWMVSEISSLYNATYKLAYDTAKRAEKSYAFELGISDSSFIQFGYWDGLRKGLLAGEKLMLDLRRMEMSYIEKNSRELEITKPVSIAQLNPYAILELQETGKCEFFLPEALFDLDFPGHYFRRIRSVRLTIPCVAGPYTSVSATLTLLSNSMRKNPTGDYERTDENDPRFTDQRIGIQSIATSQPNDATGMFDFSFRDERYLPFEGAGAESRWRLELPAELRQFDYRSIGDIVLHVSYTAREDGRLKTAANKWLKEGIDKYIGSLIESEEKINLVLSLKRDFPEAWQSLLDSGQAEIKPCSGHVPYFLRDYELVFGICEYFSLDSKGARHGLGSVEPNVGGEYGIAVDNAASCDDVILSLSYSIG
jgi:hypothetical protein